MKRQHPAEVAAETDMICAIRSADHFMASLFVGRGEYRKKTAHTVAAALREATNLEADSAAHTRRCMIYAVSQDGRATFLSNELIARLRAIA